jgi:hypothetical protein
VVDVFAVTVIVFPVVQIFDYWKNPRPGIAELFQGGPEELLAEWQFCSVV